MKCIIYTTNATSKLLFTLGYKIMQRVTELKLKVRPTHAIIAHERVENKCCVNIIQTQQKYIYTVPVLERFNLLL